jgi:hypothetical protein
MPLDETPAVFCDESVLHLPALKVDGDPGALALGPTRPHALKGLSDGEQRLVGTLQTLVVFVDFLGREIDVRMWVRDAEWRRTLTAVLRSAAVLYVTGDVVLREDSVRRYWEDGRGRRESVKPTVCSQ